MNRAICLGLFLAFGLSGCGDDDDGGATDAAPADASAPDGGNTAVARGDYLVNHVSLCGDCHTPRDATGAPIAAEFLAGAECFIDIDPSAGVGCLHTRNLTDHETGLANRTDAQIRAMFQDGRRPNDEALIPVMPYWIYHNMTDEDADAIVAYLRTVPGVDHEVPASEEPWARPAEPAPPIAAGDIPAPAPEDASYESAMRGRYLATMAGLCMDCHTPMTDCGGPACPLDMTRPFQGGRAFGGLPSPPFDTEVAISTNLTPHDPTGIGAYSTNELEAAIRDGSQRDGTIICPPMPSGAMAALAGLTDADLTDIINYLLSNTAVETEETPSCDLAP